MRLLGLVLLLLCAGPLTGFAATDADGKPDTTTETDPDCE
jgi:hypothetical protein